MMTAVVALLTFSALEDTTRIAALEDTTRAKMKIPRSHVQGKSIQQSLTFMNAAHKRSLPTGVTGTPCEEFSAGELTALLTTLYHARDPTLEAIYRDNPMPDGSEDGRRLQARGTKTDSLNELTAEWAAEAKLVAANPELASTSRDGRCFDVVNWWTHQLTVDSRNRLAAAGTVTRLPLLPEGMPASKPHGDHIERTAADAVFSSHAASQSCASCHANSAVTKTNSEAKAWPASLSYNATGPLAESDPHNQRPGTLGGTIVLLRLTECQLAEIPRGSVGCISFLGQRRPRLLQVRSEHRFRGGTLCEVRRQSRV